MHGVELLRLLLGQLAHAELAEGEEGDVGEWGLRWIGDVSMGGKDKVGGSVGLGCGAKGLLRHGIRKAWQEGFVVLASAMCAGRMGVELGVVSQADVVQGNYRCV